MPASPWTRSPRTRVFFIPIARRQHAARDVGEPVADDVQRDEELSDPRPTLNSAPISGNAVATSNQFRVRAMMPRLITGSIRQRRAPLGTGSGGHRGPLVGGLVTPLQR